MIYLEEIVYFIAQRNLLKLDLLKHFSLLSIPRFCTNHAISELFDKYKNKILIDKKNFYTVKTIKRNKI